jgi:hypothetical protein
MITFGNYITPIHFMQLSLTGLDELSYGRGCLLLLQIFAHTTNRFCPLQMKCNHQEHVYRPITVSGMLERREKIGIANKARPYIQILKGLSQHC